MAGQAKLLNAKKYFDIFVFYICLAFTAR